LLISTAVRAATAIFPKPKDRTRPRVIVALTADVEVKSSTGLTDLITGLLEADTTLFGVILAAPPSPPPSRFPIRGNRKPVQTGSILPAIEATGGEVAPGDLFSERLPGLIRRARRRYLLGFYAEPSPTRRYHLLDVRLSPGALALYPNALVRARKGFYAEPATADH